MKSIIRKISKYNFSSRSGQSIKYIVMHFTGNRNDTALNNANYFGEGNRNASANYFVDNTSIVQVVEENNASWHCGDGNGKYGITNQNSIGIEMCGTNGEIAKDTESNTIDLVKQLMKKYDISSDRVVRHYDASRKVCPSPWSKNNWSKWNDFKKKLTNNEGMNNNIATTPIAKETIDVTYQVYSNKKWLPNVVNLKDYAGLYGKGVQGVYASLSKGKIRYRVHINNRWLPWVIDRQDYAGILGTNIDGLQMELIGLPGYSVKYRTYVGGRWLPWVLGLKDYAGLYGKAIEGIQVQVIKK